MYALRFGPFGPTLMHTGKGTKIYVKNKKYKISIQALY